MTHSVFPRIAISSGIPALDAYLDAGYEEVLGMSSRFAAGIAGALLRIQTGMGITGDIAEIGTFKGRYFIAMMKALAAGERGLGIDSFEWPSPACWDEFLANCDRHGVARESYTPWKADTRDMTVEQMREKLGGRPVRFFHIDGDHSDVCLSKDLELATAVMHPKGVLCLDDMLHPGYPTLVATVLRYIERRPEMRVFCVIDREDIVAAPKFMLCRRDIAETYETALMEAFPQFHWWMGADFVDYGALVLTPYPRLAKVD